MCQIIKQHLVIHMYLKQKQYKALVYSATLFPQMVKGKNQNVVVVGICIFTQLY